MLVELLMASLGQSEFFAGGPICFHNTFTCLTQASDLLRVQRQIGHGILVSPVYCMSWTNTESSIRAPRTRTFIAGADCTV
jgi:hypothetical protein